MVIEVRLYESMERVSFTNTRNVITVDVEDGITIEELAAEMDIDLAEVKSVKVNGTLGEPAFVLSDGDKVGLYF